MYLTLESLSRLFDGAWKSRISQDAPLDYFRLLRGFSPFTCGAVAPRRARHERARRASSFPLAAMLVLVRPSAHVSPNQGTHTSPHHPSLPSAML